MSEWYISIEPISLSILGRYRWSAKERGGDPYHVETGYALGRASAKRQAQRKIRRVLKARRRSAKRQTFLILIKTKEKA